MKIKSIKYTLFAIVLWYLMLLPKLGVAQDSLSAYIQYGLNNNLVVQQKVLNLEKSSLALSSARSLFLPSVNFNGLVSHADGGRYADLPLGDMLNPVYSTLNQLTSSSAFPQIENQSINFLPQKYYDVYFRTSMPLYNPSLKLNESIQERQSEIKSLELIIYKRQLVFEIKRAYYEVQSANAAVKIYKQAVVLLERNFKVNQSLLSNGVGLQASVLRSEAELEKIKSALSTAESNLKNAMAYFNFLINKPLDAYVYLMSDEEIEILMTGSDSNEFVQVREELELLNASGSIQQSLLKMNESVKLPTVGAFVDFGAQAVNFEVSKKAPYYMVGVTVAIPIYNGANNYKIMQSRLDCQMNDLQTKQVEQSLVLSKSISEQSVETAKKKLASENTSLKSAESYFNLIEKGYKEGIHSLIEYIDARSQLTEAQMRRHLAVFELLIAQSDLERQNASFKF